MNAKEKISKAKILLQGEQPFFGFQVTYLECEKDNKNHTMGVDPNGKLFYNKEFVEKLSIEELMGVLSHEILHVTLGHIWKERVEGKNAKLWNLAIDIVVNYYVLSSGLELPENGIIPEISSDGEIEILDSHITNIKKKTAEEIYEELFKENKQNKSGGKSGKRNKKEQDSGKGFDKHVYKEISEGERNEEKSREMERKWKGVLSDSVVYAKDRGKVPKGMERILDKILNPKVNWKQKLYKYITNTLPRDYTYAKPNPKSVNVGVYLPSITKENMDVTVHVDTSGSISQKVLQEFMGEMIGIAKSFSNVDMTIIVCDANIQRVYEVKNGNIEKLKRIKPSGGGGTSHKPVVEWINKNQPNCKVFISLTDGYSDIQKCYNNLPYGCGKVIALTKDSRAEEEMKKYGEVVKIE